jgi:hypothetical protein
LCNRRRAKHVNGDDDAGAAGELLAAEGIFPRAAMMSSRGFAVASAFAELDALDYHV